VGWLKCKKDGDPCVDVTKNFKLGDIPGIWFPKGFENKVVACVMLLGSDECPAFKE